MPLTLSTIALPGFDQVLGAVAGLLDKVAAHCAEAGIDEREIVEARLAPDMLPFSYQVKSVAVHSAGALAGVQRGRFSPDTTTPPETLEALAARIAAARAALAAIDPAELDGLADREVVFAIGESFRLRFTATNFLLSFSTPNLHFHAATAYALLRARGVAIGKVDYLGQMRIGFPA